MTVTNDKDKMNETKNGELEMEKENQILFFYKVRRQGTNSKYVTQRLEKSETTMTTDFVQQQQKPMPCRIVGLKQVF